MADLIHVNGKLWSAVQILVKHPGPLHERLSRASVELCQVSPAPLSEELRPYYERISRLWEGKPGNIEDSIAKLSVEEMETIAGDVLSLASQVDNVLKN